MTKVTPILTEDIKDGAVITEKIKDGIITIPKIKLDEIQVKIPQVFIERGTGSLAADSVGVKYTSPIKLRLLKKHVKSGVIRTTWVASHTDSRTNIYIWALTDGIKVAEVSGNAGTNVEGAVTLPTTDNQLCEMRVEVTTASATAGATTACHYAVAELLLGIS